jgi:hypothetical protein
LSQLSGVNAGLLAVSQNPVAIGITSHQSGRRQRIIHPHGGQILQHIVRPAAIATGLAADVSQHVLLRVGIDELDVVDDEIAACENACAHG